MTKRLNGKGRDKEKQYPRDPHGWYIETREAVDQLLDLIDFRDSLVWDPACGSGNVLDRCRARGLPTIGSDIVDRFKPGGHRFYRGNFLNVTKWPNAGERPLSIVCNPPYNEPEEGIAEAFIHRTLNMIPFYRAAFLVPIEFQCGQGRYWRIWSKTPPSHVISLCERPSMPPGAAVSALGDRAFEGGMADYIWIVWTAGGPHRTEHLFARPSSAEDLPDIPRRIKSPAIARPGGSAIERRI